MAHSSLRRLAVASVVTGVSSIALAAPASAMLVPDPHGDPLQGTTPVLTQDPGMDWAPVGLGAAGGLALIGAGALAAAGLRHRRQAVHPA